MAVMRIRGIIVVTKIRESSVEGLALEDWIKEVSFLSDWFFYGISVTIEI